MRIIVTFLALFGLLAAFPATLTRAQDVKPRDEYEVKAQIILNLPLVTNWPDGAVPADGKIRLCTLTEGKISDYLQAMVSRPSYRDHILYVPNVSFSQLQSCQVLLINGEDRALIKAAMEEIAGLPVLTVGTPKGFIAKGGMIGFLNTQKKLGLFSQKNVKFEVNLKNTAAVGITLDPLLLELAESIVTEGGER